MGQVTGPVIIQIVKNYLHMAKLQIFTLKFGINRCYIIKDEGAIMIDGGPPGKGKVFQSKLEDLSVQYQDIRLIVLTHGDFDHVGSAKQIKEITGAQIAIHESDKINLEEGRFNWPPGVTNWGKISHFLFSPLLSMMSIPSMKADIILHEEDYSLEQYGVKGKIIYTPGHTPGSVSVLLDTGEAFIGCLAHNGFPFTLHPRLPIYAEELSEIKKSWELIISQGAKMIYPGHGNPFPVEMIKRYL
jgi:glyoxylase-like metal-dependent hydrolase (beta-lactamase superfamily II)